MGVRTKKASQTPFCVLHVSRARGADTRLALLHNGKIPRRGNNHPCEKPSRPTDAGVHASPRPERAGSRPERPVSAPRRADRPQPDPETEPARGRPGPIIENRPWFLPRGLQKAGRGKEQGSRAEFVLAGKEPDGFGTAVPTMPERRRPALPWLRFRTEGDTQK